VAIRTLRSARSSISGTVSFLAIHKYFEGSVPCSRSTLNTPSSVFLSCNVWAGSGLCFFDGGSIPPQPFAPS